VEYLTEVHQLNINRVMEGTIQVMLEAVDLIQSLKDVLRAGETIKDGGVGLQLENLGLEDWSGQLVDGNGVCVGVRG
jgi:hypothetical protein